MPDLAVEVAAGDGFEALLALAMFTGDEPEDSYQVGAGWFSRARQLASARLKAAIAELVGKEGPRWFLMLGAVRESPECDLDGLIAHVRALPTAEVMRILLCGRVSRLQSEEGRQLIARAVAGDVAAGGRLAALSNPAGRRGNSALIKLGPERARDLCLEVLERWRDEVFSPLCGADTPALLADAAARKATGLSGRELIERTTDGMSYEGEAGIDRAILVPSIVNRPWIVHVDWETTKVICYPARDAESAPSAAAVYRALGDESRLRILRELARGEKRLTDLSQELGLAKSTIHAHLLVLRAAGLVRVTVGEEKRFALRPDMPDLGGMLTTYLKGSDAGLSHT